MHLNQPSVTVIVPVFNGERFLAEALTSICQQEYHPLEVLVVDDGSTDHSTAVASTFSAVHVLRKLHNGIAATLNHGLRHATGELLAFWDADDRWLPGNWRAKSQNSVCDLILTWSLGTPGSLLCARAQ